MTPLQYGVLPRQGWWDPRASSLSCSTQSLNPVTQLVLTRAYAELRYNLPALTGVSQPARAPSSEQAYETFGKDGAVAVFCYLCPGRWRNFGARSRRYTVYNKRFVCDPSRRHCYFAQDSRRH